MSMIAREIKDDGFVYYDFICEGCEVRGSLGIPIKHNEAIDCPEGCGAVYLQWKSIEGDYKLTCVVCPVFEDIEEGVQKRQPRHEAPSGAEGETKQ